MLVVENQVIATLDLGDAEQRKTHGVIKTGEDIQHDQGRKHGVDERCNDDMLPFWKQDVAKQVDLEKTMLLANGLFEADFVPDQAVIEMLAGSVEFCFQFEFERLDAIDKVVDASVHNPAYLVR
ncbi:conserved hypothetical protein [Ricinus communis]|uniref:Uncharacterized protein n=1 Tax=Ricinus communis TaxID=3988 RepID=B9TH01_RICCO|nr:conserved hypothetical protein [Ricinus communis]